jgi:hypothetical protein
MTWRLERKREGEGGSKRKRLGAGIREGVTTYNLSLRSFSDLRLMSFFLSQKRKIHVKSHPESEMERKIHRETDVLVRI